MCPELIFHIASAAVSLTFHGIGKEIGTFITGVLFDKIGTELTLCCFAVVTLVWLALFTTYILTKDLNGYTRVSMKEVETDDSG